MKKVLIAIDYNPTSEQVALQGYELAKMLDAEICLVHVVADVRYYGMQYPTFMGFDSYEVPLDVNLHGEITKVADSFLETAAQHLNDPSVTTHIAEGNTADAILEYAKEWGATLIVMGTHSHGTLEKFLVGTVASRILEHTKIPIYMIPIKKG